MCRCRCRSPLLALFFGNGRGLCFHRQLLLLLLLLSFVVSGASAIAGLTGALLFLSMLLCLGLCG
jgi:hypothetical protein